MKSTLTQTVENFARVRQMEREATQEQEAHHIFLLHEDGNTTKVGSNGDPYEMMERLAVRLMLDKIKLGDIAGVIVETPAHAVQATDYDEAQEADDSQRISVVVTAGHDGAEIVSFITTNEPEKAERLGLPTGSQDAQEGRLADTLEKITLSILMAQIIEKRGKNSDD